MCPFVVVCIKSELNDSPFNTFSLRDTYITHTFLEVSCIRRMTSISMTSLWVTHTLPEVGVE